MATTTDKRLAGLSLFSGVTGAFSRFQQAKAERGLGEVNVRLAEFKARDALRRGDERIGIARGRARRIKGAQRFKEYKENKELKDKLAEQFHHLKEMEKKRMDEIEALQAEKILLEEILPWRFIIKSDLEELQKHCKDFGLSTRGDKANLRDRLMRHVLKINLPVGDLFLEGKLNIILWTYYKTCIHQIWNVTNVYTSFGKEVSL